jgi:hypothetical protein
VRHAPQNLQAVHSGHDVVEQNQADRPAIGSLEDLQCRFATRGGSRLVAETSDAFLKNAALGGIVIDDQDDLGHLAGYST